MYSAARLFETFAAETVHVRRARRLSENSEIDGHDEGSGEINIFIRTNNPGKTLSEAKAILGSRDFWVDARVAYREVAKGEYTILWPKELNQFKIK